MSTLATLQAILIEEFKRPPEQLRPEATLADLAIDSLEFVDLMFRIEDRFGLKVKDDVPQGLVTLEDVSTYIDELLENRSAQERGHATGADRVR
jgi:acyl carrier protein